jgi:site-specific DNA-methyltransferase (adenine-specific)
MVVCAMDLRQKKENPPTRSPGAAEPTVTRQKAGAYFAWTGAESSSLRHTAVHRLSPLQEDLALEGWLDPYYDDGQITLYCGDCRFVMLAGIQPGIDAILTDPPYGNTALIWDQPPDGCWLELAASLGIPTVWCFGSLRFWLSHGHRFTDGGWRYAQEVVWEKHNGSGFHADRFKRVHEIAVQWYRGAWGALYKDVPQTMDGVASSARRTQPPAQMGPIARGAYSSEDGGPRLMRSVLQVRSEHGRAVHPTQKPLGVLRPLITYSVPGNGLVLDPFAGSGSTLIAARELGRRAIGIEVPEEYCEAAVTRFAQRTVAV